MTRRTDLAFNGDGQLVGDHALAMAELMESVLVKGPEPLPAGWDEAHRYWLVTNLATLVGHLQTAGITEIWIGGSFASTAPRPGDIDGYFIRPPAMVRDGSLLRTLTKLEPAWGWGPYDRKWSDEQQTKKLDIWHQYRVELMPEDPERPHWAAFFRSPRPPLKGRRGMVRIVEEDEHAAFRGRVPKK